MEIATLSRLSSPRSSLLRLLVAAAAVLAAVPAAQGADKARAAPATKPKDAIMSQAQLRECVSKKEVLGQRNEGALKAKADIVAAKAEIDRTGAENAAAQTTLDRTKKDDVDAFNVKVLARNALVEDYQAKAANFNKEVEDIQTLQDSYSAACSNRRYDDRDLADIQRGKK
ncbi:MAG: hypothetical protein ABIZ18_14085 [Caldimonas sp.]